MSAVLTPEDAADQPDLTPLGTVQPVRVTAYRTSDGAVHATRPEADEREAVLSLKHLANDFDPSSVIALTGFLDRNALALSSILNRLIKAREKMQAPESAA